MMQKNKTKSMAPNQIEVLIEPNNERRAMLINIRLCFLLVEILDIFGGDFNSLTFSSMRFVPLFGDALRWKTIGLTESEVVRRNTLQFFFFLLFL
jgi:hypothetical protein